MAMSYQIVNINKNLEIILKEAMKILELKM